MNDLHWTGAALLLAVALGGSTRRTRSSTVVDWQDFAREHGLHEDATAPATTTSTLADASGDVVAPRAHRKVTVRALRPVPPDLAAYQPAPSGRTTRLRATATCGHCGRQAGDLEWDGSAPAKRAILRPTGGAPPHVVPLGSRLRCAHCSGPVFAEEPEPIVVHAQVAVRPARRGLLHSGHVDAARLTPVQMRAELRAFVGRQAAH